MAGTTMLDSKDTAHRGLQLTMAGTQSTGQEIDSDFTFKHVYCTSMNWFNLQLSR